MYNQDSLEHFGVLGMKWGKRKAQGQSVTVKKTRVKSEEHLQKKELKKKRIDEMTDDELKKLNSRLQLETTYKNLKASDVSPGRKFVKSFLDTSAKTAATAGLTVLTTAAAAKIGSSFVNKALSAGPPTAGTDLAINIVKKMLLKK